MHWLNAVRMKMDEPYVLWIAWEMGDTLLYRDMVVQIAEGVSFQSLDNENSERAVQFGPSRTHWTPGHRYATHIPMIPLDFFRGVSEDKFSETISRARILMIESTVRPYCRILSQMRIKANPLTQNPSARLKDNCMKFCIPTGVGSLVIAGITDSFNIWDSQLPVTFSGKVKQIVDHLAAIKIQNSACANCQKMFQDELANARSVTAVAIKCLAPLSQSQQERLDKRGTQLALGLENVVDKGMLHMYYL
ncbi:hypothetical protein BDP81DRAFT_51013 [Colletotrichum phormii]|uniref:Uncharacterized protein n=1 Tax=Colletotrichum phormii TaxID=359342 RepID=A0AAI9ZMD4_9PEZI|nr:uncharacterized protein BDP81DRAFT_51013 [Colletotrichum phormii]KAK1634662.1 hypothetical protein BDP81DRAFT_51013 [Colletotrichum phormii]